MIGGWAEFSIGVFLISTLIVWNWVTNEVEINPLEVQVGQLTKSLESLDAQQQGTIDYLIQQSAEIEMQFEELAIEVNK